MPVRVPEDDMIADLSRHPWAREVLTRLRGTGGAVIGNEPLVHELRFAHELMAAGIAPHYEAPGAATSHIDFSFTTSGVDWRVELLRLNPRQEGSSLSATAGSVLTRHAEELLYASQRICTKLHSLGQPYKFEPPAAQINVLFVDVTTLGELMWEDFRRIAFGGFAARPELRKNKAGCVVDGVFAEANEAYGSEYARERLHVLGFARPAYWKRAGEGRPVRFAFNSALVSRARAAELVAAWPIERVRIVAPLSSGA